MEKDSKESLEKQILILKKKLERSENSRIRIEQAMDNFGLVYRSNIEKLLEQKNLLNIKNQQLDAAHKELIANNEKLVYVSTTDELTQLYNRRKISVILDEEYMRAKRYGTTFSAIMLDLDWFKNINDTYGHQAGDHVLEIIAQFMKSKIRTSDYVGRWGGEEFFMILPSNNANDSLKLAERLRVQISKLHFELGFSLTCSFGITEYKEGDSIEEIIKRTDNALYKAKEKRNATCIF